MCLWVCFGGKNTFLLILVLLRMIVESAVWPNPPLAVQLEWEMATVKAVLWMFCDIKYFTSVSYQTIQWLPPHLIDKATVILSSCQRYRHFLNSWSFWLKRGSFSVCRTASLCLVHKHLTLSSPLCCGVLWSLLPLNEHNASPFQRKMWITAQFLGLFRQKLYFFYPIMHFCCNFQCWLGFNDNKKTKSNSLFFLK